MSDSKKCDSWFGGHEFGKWRVVERYSLERKSLQGGAADNIGWGIRQERECGLCGYTQVDVTKKLGI